MNCTAMKLNLYSYPINHPNRIQIERECFSDSLTIILTMFLIILGIISTFFEKIN